MKFGVYMQFLEKFRFEKLAALLRGSSANRSKAQDQKARAMIAIGIFAFSFSVLAIRLVGLGFSEPPTVSQAVGAEAALAAGRPDIVDRNGEVLASDIKTPSVYINPRQVVDVDDAVERLTSVLPDLDTEKLRTDLQSNRAFLFIKREITPRQQAQIHELGIPGINFLQENRRVYPAGATTSHLLGLVNVDHEGISGIEKYIDGTGLAALREAGIATDGNLAPVELALDLRVQYALHQELSQAMETFSAKAASGVIMDVNSGEIVAMVSLPDFDPYQPEQALEADRLNRIISGVYELGSVFKTFTYAMLLDSGLGDMNSEFDATRPIRVGSFTISDFHGANRVLRVPEAFTLSSNIAAARVALQVGIERHQEFLRRIGMFDRLRTELPESSAPLLPRDWAEVSTMTIAYGHGISVSPLQAVTATAAMVNGGYYIPPTFLPRSDAEAREVARQVIQPQTSRQIRYLLRLNAEEGTGRRANVEGYRIGGKTGTAEKIVNGRYDTDRRLNSFMGAFPMDDPQYAFLITIDEPQAIAANGGGATAGFNAVPTAGRIVEQIAPMLGVAPKFEDVNVSAQAILASY
jgi:cell division protein FtsI (penicillin-binding protein 3)